MSVVRSIGDGSTPDASRTVPDRPAVDPVLVEIVAGSLASIEAEVETAIARTARSPMIRDAHDFRVGIHDRRCGSSLDGPTRALVHPVARDYPLDTMRPGDVFFHNDVYLSEGGIGHLPDLCVTVPVFCDGAVVRSSRRSATTTTSAASCPDRCRATPERVRRRADGPADPALGGGRPNTAALAIMARNSRMPESLAADLDAECSASLMGARRLGELFDRYGRDAVEACFDTIIERTTETFRREILAKIPVGSWVWEDYAEQDGVDPPRLHAERITLTRTGPDDPAANG